MDHRLLVKNLSIVEIAIKNKSTQFQNHPRQIVGKLLFFLKTQNHCQGASAQS